ncbi:MAG: hypothetical protein NT025_09880 [bacterium]|nr:hypothetical protein [bacterium]
MDEIASLRLPFPIGQDICVLRRIQAGSAQHVFSAWDSTRDTALAVQQVYSPDRRSSTIDAATADIILKELGSVKAAISGRVASLGGTRFCIWEVGDGVSLNEAFNRQHEQGSYLPPSSRLYVACRLAESLTALLARTDQPLVSCVSRLRAFPSFEDVWLSRDGSAHLWAHRIMQTASDTAFDDTAPLDSAPARSVLASLLECLVGQPLSSDWTLQTFRNHVADKRFPAELLPAAIVMLECDSSSKMEKALERFVMQLELYTLTLEYDAERARTALMQWVEPHCQELEAKKPAPEPVPLEAQLQEEAAGAEANTAGPQGDTGDTIQEQAHAAIGARTAQLAARRARRRRNQHWAVASGAVLVAAFAVFQFVAGPKGQPKPPAPASFDSVVPVSAATQPSAVNTEPALPLKSEATTSQMPAPVEAAHPSAPVGGAAPVSPLAPAPQSLERGIAPRGSFEEALEVLRKKTSQADFMRTASDYLKLNVLQLVRAEQASTSLLPGSYGAFFESEMLEDIVLYDGSSFSGILSLRTYHPDDLRNRKCLWFRAVSR